MILVSEGPPSFSVATGCNGTQTVATPLLRHATAPYGTSSQGAAQEQPRSSREQPRSRQELPGAARSSKTSCFSYILQWFREHHVLEKMMLCEHFWSPKSSPRAPQERPRGDLRVAKTIQRPQSSQKRPKGIPRRTKEARRGHDHQQATTPGLISRPWAPPNGSKIHEMDQRSMK